MRSPKIVEHKAVRLHTTHDFLDKLRELYGVNTDYGLHKLLGVSRQAIYRYRDNVTSFDDSIAIKVAQLIDAKAPQLKVTPGYLLLCMAEERARSAGAKAWWKTLREKAAVVVLAALGLQGLPSPTQAAPGAPGVPAAPSPAQSAQPLCIMLSRRKRPFGFALQQFLHRLAFVSL